MLQADAPAGLVQTVQGTIISNAPRFLHNWDMGYRTALLKDSDIITPAHKLQTEHCRASGVTIFEWGNGFSIEGALLA